MSFEPIDEAHRDKKVFSSNVEEGWAVTYEMLKQEDENMHREYREEIDTLLVFAGLFSAVLTAFVIESYQRLEEDTTDTAAILLRQISLQLANRTMDDLLLVSPLPFQAPTAAIRVNTLWFLSLVLSLTAALFSILLKGWIREYMRWTLITPPRVAVGLRQYRYEGLQRWNLRLVLGVLPALLQLALLLFFCGLLDFLWQLHQRVAAVVGLVTIIFLTLALSTMVISIFSRTSPFRSPITRTLLRIRFLLTSLALNFHFLVVQHLTLRWFSHSLVSLTAMLELWRHKSWEEMDLKNMESADDSLPPIPRTAYVARLRAVHHLFVNVTDIEILEKVRLCLYDVTSGSITLAHCWPIVSALLGFKNTVGFDLAMQNFQTSQTSRTVNEQVVIPITIHPIWSRADNMSPSSRHFLVTLLIEAALEDAGKANESVLLTTMRLLHIFTNKDAKLNEQYIVMLAPLLEVQGRRVIFLALDHLAKAGFRSIFERCPPRDEVILLIKTSLQAHRLCMSSTRLSPHRIQHDIYKNALIAAAKFNMDDIDMIFQSRLISLLLALEEYLSLRGLAIHQLDSPDYLDSDAWLAVASIMRTYRTLVPRSLVDLLAKRMDVDLDLDDDSVTLALATVIERWIRAQINGHRISMDDDGRLSILSWDRY